MSLIGTIRGLISDTVSRIARIDSSTHALEFIDYPHHEVHAGNYYFIKTVADITGGAGTITEQLFQTPDTTQQIHARADLGEAECEFLIELFEAPDVTTEGTAQIGKNANRNFSDGHNLKAWSTPTIGASSGTLMWAETIGSGKTGGVGQGFAIPEIIAKRNTYYLFRITKVAVTSPAHISVGFSWYEHTPKN